MGDADTKILTLHNIAAFTATGPVIAYRRSVHVSA